MILLRRRRKITEPLTLAPTVECRIEDPFMLLLQYSVERIACTLDVASPLPDYSVIGPAITKLMAFASKADNNMSSTALASVLADFSAFETNFELIIAAYERTILATRATWKKKAIASQLELFKDDLLKLRLMKSYLTPAHLELQSHFYRLLVKTPRGYIANREEIETFFQPLFKLRDEYFTKARAGLLSEYLAKSKELSNSVYYLTVVLDGVDKDKLANAQAFSDRPLVELEVMSMLETF